ncbi:PREDICTED: SKI family transcriptional corepressor 2 [Vollenhovia emeryi]|uniref:SKI family transcriptional corepressor 2 n=1 Tax=Vollenhovia emeryi TaxID=411798 RepID=UPI0005F47526|nr:PREDICTED: SKI family transcriptional corepressor 2 [Vollenhovia emeryi]
MAGCISFALIAIASTVAMAESRVIPAEPLSITLDAYGNPVMFLREKRAALRPYPHRTMMFAGYYRPIRRTSNGGQATGVFAQGNAVSGEAFFGDVHAPHFKDGPEPIEEPEVSSAEAQAAPEEEQEHEYHRHHHEEEQHHHHDEEEQLHRDEPHYHHHHHHQDSLVPQGHHESDQIPLTTEIAQPTEKPITATVVSAVRPKVHHSKKTHKTPITVDADDDDEDDADEEDDEPAVPFVPFKGNRRRQGYPHLNNFFPMVFSFPRLATRAGSSGSLPGAITAIANSYSTGKGGVASSVATAYGGSPTGKKRRPQPYKE